MKARLFSAVFLPVVLVGTLVAGLHAQTGGGLGAPVSPAGTGGGGGVTVGDPVSGGTANRIMATDADGGISTASPAVGEAAHLTSTLRVDGNVDFRAIQSCGGSSQCDSVGAAGACCTVDSDGVVLSTGGTANIPPLTVVAALASGIEAALVALFKENTNGFLTIGNFTGSGGGVAPAIWTRGTISTVAGFTVAAGVEAAADSATASSAALSLRGRREGATGGATTTPSPLTGRVTAEIRNSADIINAFNTNGQIGLRHISPAALSGDVNNYAGCTTTGICRIDTGASPRTITGIVPGFNAAFESNISALLWVCATGANALTLAHASGSSSAANQFVFSGGTDKTVAAESCFPLLYDRVSQKHRAANGT
jgi:hypothetical protein